MPTAGRPAPNDLAYHPNYQEPTPARLRQALVEPLSQRELEVLRLVASGLWDGQIAHRLVVSVSTVKTHVHHICAKLEAQNRTEAVGRARDLHLV